MAQPGAAARPAHIGQAGPAARALRGLTRHPRSVARNRVPTLAIERGSCKAATGGRDWMRAHSHGESRGCALIDVPQLALEVQR